MDHPELSLGPSLSSFASSVSQANNGRKRKLSTWKQHSAQKSIDLQLNDPLPLDWEQCLDLQSGRMYCLNRKTMKKTWEKPKEQKLDLDLNISNLAENKKPGSSTLEETKKQSRSGGRGGDMVAIVCVNCHLLVMLYRSSPSCPNCKYIHSLQPSPSVLQKMEASKPLETLSLLH